MALEAIKQLLSRKVRIPAPESVFIDPATAIDRIAPEAIIHPGCRILGKETSIGPGCELGREAPATLEDCQLGAEVRLKGGFYSGAVFLNRAQLGSGAHVRPGVLLEEDAGGAHAVGLKQTVLMPFVTLGSLINFCDCLMAGGTSRKNHGEVGSSYIHFNFTPHQDKATPSLLGDVPGGVLLDQPPIFMGGQGGLVGPAQVAYGAITPAGVIVRGDIVKQGIYNPPGLDKQPSRAYQPGRYNRIDRILTANLRYIGNIIALRAWYENVRAPFMRADPFQAACHAGALKRLNEILAERLRRMEELAGKMPASIKLNGADPAGDLSGNQRLLQQKRFYECWPEMRGHIQTITKRNWAPARILQAELTDKSGQDYLETIRALSPAARTVARTELNKIVASAMNVSSQILN